MMSLDEVIEAIPNRRVEMQVKLFEVRDDATCIAAIAIKPEIGRVPDGENGEDWFAARRFLLGKSGWWGATDAILFGNLAGGRLLADPYDWPENPRTMRVAHLMAARDFDTLPDGAVLDVRVPLGLRSDPVESDRHYEFVARRPREKTADGEA